MLQRVRLRAIIRSGFPTEIFELFFVAAKFHDCFTPRCTENFAAAKKKSNGARAGAALARGPGREVHAHPPRVRAVNGRTPEARAQ